MRPAVAPPARLSELCRLRPRGRQGGGGGRAGAPAERWMGMERSGATAGPPWGSGRATHRREDGGKVAQVRGRFAVVLVFCKCRATSAGTQSITALEFSLGFSSCSCGCIHDSYYGAIRGFIACSLLLLPKQHWKQEGCPITSETVDLSAALGRLLEVQMNFFFSYPAVSTKPQNAAGWPGRSDLSCPSLFNNILTFTLPE